MKNLKIKMLSSPDIIGQHIQVEVTQPARVGVPETVMSLNLEQLDGELNSINSNIKTLVERKKALLEVKRQVRLHIGEEKAKGRKLKKRKK